jgi:endonuclease/exonuclease/phosphatase family metal-dependent hydrolase
MRLLDWNIRGGLGMDNRRSLKRIAEVIRESQADIVCLQEVHCQFPQSGFQNQPRMVERLTDMPVHFLPSFRIGISSFGNVILTRLPTSWLTLHPLPNPIERKRLKLRLERRAMLSANIQTDSGVINLFTTHLSLNTQDRMQSAREILKKVQGASGSVLLAGDFNAGPDSSEINVIRESGLVDAGISSGLTYPSNRPTHRIDYVFHSADLNVKAFKVMESTASDHCPILIEWS